MKTILYLVTMLLTFSGCNKVDVGYFDLDPVHGEHIKEPERNEPASPGSPVYKIPEVKNENDFTNKIHIDPTYSGGGSNGSIEKPFTSINDNFSKGIPSNTAFLIRRGTELNEKIGRLANGTRLTDMIYKNNFIGAYGSGEMPVVGGMWIAAGTNGLTIRDIHFLAQSQQSTGHDAVIYMHNSRYFPTSSPADLCRNVTIAYCIIEGKHNPSYYYDPTPYPLKGIKFDCDNFVLYHTEIRNIWSDGVYAGGGNGHSAVRNWIHKINLMDQRAKAENWPNPSSPDPRSDDSKSTAWGKGGTGDCWQSGGAGNNYYFAGNIFDRSNSTWKFGLIMNNGLNSNNRGVIIEWNTFLAPLSGAGGGAHYYNMPPDNICRYNLYDASRPNSQSYVWIAGGLSVIKYHLTQAPPFGIRNNHVIKNKPGDRITWGTSNTDTDHYVHESNKIFNGLEEYKIFLQTNDPVGSDIDTENFWRDVR